MEIEERLSRTTRNLYERDMRTIVLPAFKDLTLREIGVTRRVYFLKQIAKRSYSRAKHARVVSRLALALAVRHEILPRNPMHHVSRLHRKKTIPEAFTIGEVHEICAAIKAWESRRILAGPRPDRQLGQIVEVMLGTSPRIGKSSPAAPRISTWTVRSRRHGPRADHQPKGEPTHRQDHSKTDRSVRRVALPSFAPQAIRSRLLRGGDLLSTRAGTPLTTNNIRWLLRDVGDAADNENVTPHRSRRTVAIVVSDAQGAPLASELLGHTDPRITLQHHIQRNETMNPITAGDLERALGKAGRPE